MATSRARMTLPNGKLAVFQVGSKQATVQRSTYNPAYGGGGKRATRQLSWAPPALTSPITIDITNSMVSINLTAGQDYILRLPGAVGNPQVTPHQPLVQSNNGLIISGGRNVVMIGGAVRRDTDMMQGRRITSSTNYRAARNRAFFIKDWTGRFHIEGVYIGGNELYEVFNVSTKSSTASFCAQNIYVDDVVLKSPDATGESSHDGGDAGIQNWDGPADGLYVDGFTIRSSTYQAFFNQPTQFGASAPKENIFKNISIDYARPEVTGWTGGTRKLPWPYTGNFGTGNKQFVFSDTLSRIGPVTFENVWSNPDPTFASGQVASNPGWAFQPDPSVAAPGKPNQATQPDGHKLVTWPGLTYVTGGINVGVPPVKPVTPDIVGVGYVSPGYVTIVPAPTTAPTVTLGTATDTAQPLSWTAVTDATSYKVEYKTTAGSTWTVAAPAVTGTSYTVTGLSAGVSYDYRVSAATNGGTGPTSTVVTGSTVSATAPTAAPTLTPGTATASTQSLSWTSVANATSYSVERKLTSATDWTVDNSNVTGTTYTVTDLTANTSYDYRVRGSNGSGSGPYSNVATVSTLSAPTPANAYEDTFDGASGTMLNTTGYSGASNLLTLDGSGQAQVAGSTAGSGTTYSAVRSTPTTSIRQHVELDISAVGTTSPNTHPRILFSSSSDGNSRYEGYYSGASWVIARVVGSGQTFVRADAGYTVVVDGTTTPAPTAPYTLTAEVDGTTVRIKNGSTVVHEAIDPSAFNGTYTGFAIRVGSSSSTTRTQQMLQRVTRLSARNIS